MGIDSGSFCPWKFYKKTKALMCELVWLKGRNIRQVVSVYLPVSESEFKSIHWSTLCIRIY